MNNIKSNAIAVGKWIANFAKKTWIVISILSVIFTFATLWVNYQAYAKKTHMFFAQEFIVKPVVAEKK